MSDHIPEDINDTIDIDDIEEIEILPLPLPLDAWHRERGARMVEFAGYHMPIQYEGIMAEHSWTRTNAGLFDVSHMGQLMLSGAEDGTDGTNDADAAAAALERLVPGDISALAQGRMRYSLLLAEDGGILDDLMITRTPMGLYLVVNGAVKMEDMAYLRGELPDEITLNYMEDRALLALQGPKAAKALARIVPGAAKLFFMEADMCLWGEHPLWISRSGYTGEDGFEISLAAELAREFADALCAQSEVKPIGLGARDSLRLEAGLPLYGHDLDEQIDLVQADLKFALSKRRREEGGFYGADRILTAYRDGPDKKRVGFAVDGRMPVREGAVIFAGDEAVGVMTSGGFAPTVAAPIAMGYVAAGYTEIGTELTAEVRGKRIAITVAAMPFVAHNYHRKGKSL